LVKRYHVVFNGREQHIFTHVKSTVDGKYCYAPAEAAILHDQNGYGRIEKDGRLRLDLYEALYLIARGKIEVQGYTFDSLLTTCCADSSFLRNFIVYRDVRERGYVISAGIQDFRIFPRGQRPGNGNSRYLMRILSERDVIEFTSIIHDVKTAINMRKQFVLAVLDDEHELTYYEIRITTLNGREVVDIPNDIHATLAGVPSFVMGDFVESLEKNWFGTMLDVSRLFLSPLETAWLMEQGKLTLNPPMTSMEYQKLAKTVDSEFSEKYQLYCFFKKLGFYPRSGYKYGHHFRVYTESNNHSEMLAHAVPAGSGFPMSEISRSVRLAHSVKKRMLFASINGEEITCIEFARLKM